MVFQKRQFLDNFLSVARGPETCFAHDARLLGYSNRTKWGVRLDAYTLGFTRRSWMRRAKGQIHGSSTCNKLASFEAFTSYFNKRWS